MLVSVFGAGREACDPLLRGLVCAFFGRCTRREANLGKSEKKKTKRVGFRGTAILAITVEGSLAVFFVCPAAFVGGKLGWKSASDGTRLNLDE